MTSMQFYDYPKIVPRPPIEWGTLDLQSEHFDPTVIKAPTYNLK